MEKKYSYGNRDGLNSQSWEEDTKRNKYTLRIANCRGKKPVVNDIKKAIKILQDIQIEINPCEAKSSLLKAELLLRDVLFSNQ